MAQPDYYGPKNGGRALIIGLVMLFTAAALNNNTKNLDHLQISKDGDEVFNGVVKGAYEVNHKIANRHRISVTFVDGDTREYYKKDGIDWEIDKNAIPYERLDSVKTAQSHLKKPVISRGYTLIADSMGMN